MGRHAIHNETQMTEFVDLQRRFLELSDSELEDIESLLAWSGSEFGPDIGWSELLQYARVILLAEAGSGKTVEMQQQANRLTGEGRFAFFIPLESLGQGQVTDTLSPAEEKRFDQWKSDGRDPAWLFLDAVDELKLTDGKLDRALIQLSKAIDGCLDRARIIISCRPSDWRSDLDLHTVQQRLPVPETRRDSSVRPPEEVFIGALRNEGGGQSHVTPEEDESPTQGTARTVAMLPMRDEQIKLFAEWRGIGDPGAFLAEIARQDASNFARRPRDLTDLIEVWSSSGRLGTRAEQHEANVTAKLKDDPERPDRGVLADTKARLGAERLALALALTRTRTIRSPDQVTRPSPNGQRSRCRRDSLPIGLPRNGRRCSGGLSSIPPPTAVFASIIARFRNTLLRSACGAWHEKGMSIRALFRLLFAELYGVEGRACHRCARLPHG